MALKLVYPNGKPKFNPEKIASEDENGSWRLFLCTSHEINHPFLFIDLKIRNTHLLPDICIKDPKEFLRLPSSDSGESESEGDCIQFSDTFSISSWTVPLKLIIPTEPILKICHLEPLNIEGTDYVEYMKEVHRLLTNINEAIKQHLIL
ncbi:hypothetical protein [Leptospira interrogans]|uniref:hypothetical protein n=1 Tax=Leptospira interrogans TaxID=173 RepID=UPI0002B99B7E|nr:hypothetical protein [Leptospira interrogans]